MEDDSSLTTNLHHVEKMEKSLVSVNMSLISWSIPRWFHFPLREIKDAHLGPDETCRHSRRSESKEVGISFRPLRIPRLQKSDQERVTSSSIYTTKQPWAYVSTAYNILIVLCPGN